MRFNLKDYLKYLFYILCVSVSCATTTVCSSYIEGEGRLNAIDFSQMAIAESISTFVGTFILFQCREPFRGFTTTISIIKRVKRSVSSVIIGILFRGLIIIGLAVILGDYLASFSQDSLNEFSTYGYGAIVIAINRAIIVVTTTLYRNQNL